MKPHVQCSVFLAALSSWTAAHCGSAASLFSGGGRGLRKDFLSVGCVCVRALESLMSFCGQPAVKAERYAENTQTGEQTTYDISLKNTSLNLFNSTSGSNH